MIQLDLEVDPGSPLSEEGRMGLATLLLACSRNPEGVAIRFKARIGWGFLSLNPSFAIRNRHLIPWLQRKMAVVDPAAAMREPPPELEIQPE